MTQTDSNDGHPKFIYGTAWKEDETAQLTKTAIKSGFRAIDTANQRKHYHEAGVGNAIEELVEEEIVERSDLFIQTKFTYQSGQDHRLPYDPGNPHSEQVKESLESSLEHLGTDYIDSLILHGPQTRSGLTDVDREVWQTFEELHESEKVRHIGLSNVSAEQVQKLLDFANEKPSYIQNRCFARSAWDRTVREICEDQDIAYQGFSLLTANKRILQSETITKIAKTHEITIPQVIFSFALQIGMIPLTGTTSEEHMRQDLNCLKFALEDDEIEEIETISD